MKRTLLLIITILSAIPMLAGDKVNIIIAKTGTLDSLLKKHTAISSLTIRGTLNKADLASIKRFVAYADTPTGNHAGLKKLNLSRTVIKDFETSIELYDILSGATSLTDIKIGEAFYIPSRCFHNLPNLKTVDFNGNIGHIDGFAFANLPKLKRITFHGCVISTGGAEFVNNCPLLKSVTFKKPLININFGNPIDCPVLKGYTTLAPVINSSDSAFHQTANADKFKNYNWNTTFAFIERWADRCYNDTEKFFVRMANSILPDCIDYAGTIGDTLFASHLKNIMIAYDKVLFSGKLDILRQSAPYQRTKQTSPAFTYASPNDSLLTRTRDYFNLDKVAGNGDELSRIKKLLYWCHDLVRHDGSSKWPTCKYNCVDLYNVCQTEKRGINCRFMAMMLCEALLAEGIPARYLTCQSKAYDSDNDCHVITVAWSRQLNKWIWVDPTFCAYITDENGLLLHPGEVRQRLINGQPLTLNPDANWNHESMQTKEEYLEEYMAKNLYLISSCVNAMSEPEASGQPSRAGQITLVPEGFEYKWGQTTTDDAYFWQAPPKELVK